VRCVSEDGHVAKLTSRWSQGLEQQHCGGICVVPRNRTVANHADSLLTGCNHNTLDRCVLPVIAFHEAVRSWMCGEVARAAICTAHATKGLQLNQTHLSSSVSCTVWHGAAAMPTCSTQALPPALVHACYAEVKKRGLLPYSRLRDDGWAVAAGELRELGRHERGLDNGPERLLCVHIKLGGVVRVLLDVQADCRACGAGSGQPACEASG
jgi:hypothetical protein